MKWAPYPSLIRALLRFAAAQGRGALAEDRQIDEGPQDPQQQLQAQAEAAVAWYELKPDADAPTPMHAKVVLRWIDASRGQTSAGILVSWTDDGRPEAAATLFAKVQEGVTCHKLISLSCERRIVATDGDRILRSPTAAGVEFPDLPSAPPSAQTADARMRQMKSMSGAVSWRQRQDYVMSPYVATLSRWTRDAVFMTDWRMSLLGLSQSQQSSVGDWSPRGGAACRSGGMAHEFDAKVRGRITQ
jgi:hypothetical protein